MFVLAALLAAAAPATAPGGCLDASLDRDLPVSFTGRLERHIYPGPPNYESIRRGDRAEPTYILVLDRPICLTGESGTGAPRAPFHRVQLFASRDPLWVRLRAGVGHRVRITGIGFPAHSGHHREPLVVDVSSLQIRR